MKLCLLSIVLAASVFQSLYAQNRVISGTVRDAVTQVPLTFSSIIPAGQEAAGTLSGADGKFRIMIRAGETPVRITISLIGYKTDTLWITSSTVLPNELVILLEEESRTLDEVVITGSSKATTIRENPLAIALVAEKELSRTPESNLMESLSRHVPGLSTVTTGPNISKPFIRGLGYNRVLTLYDGVRQEGQQWGDEHGIEVDNYNVEKAEVIKGPASLLYGSDAVAGVVSLFPFVPRERGGVLHGQFLSEYQSNNGLAGSGVRLYSGREKIDWLVSTSLRKAKNYSNRIDGRVYNTGFEEKNITTSLGFRSGTGGSRINFTLYDNRQGIPDGSRDSVSRKFTRQVYEGPLDDVKHRPVVSDKDLEAYELSPLHQRIQHYRFYSTHSYLLPKGDISFQLAFQQNRRREFNHPTQPGQAGLNVRLNTVNYGMRYNAPSFSGFEISAGINGMLQQNKNKEATDFPIPDYRLSDAGGYGFFMWKKVRWTATGGVRFDHRKITSRDFYVRNNDENGFLEHASLPDTAGAVLHSPALHQNFSGVSLSIGTAYTISDKVSLKFNLARGYRAPNIAEIASNGLDPGAHIVYIGNRNFVPEFSFQGDLGATAEFSDFSFALSIFNNSIRNYIYLSQAVDNQGNPAELVQGNKTFQYKQSSARLYGAEVSFDFYPGAVKGFRLANNVSVVYGNNTSTEFKNRGTDGYYLPFIPPLKLMSSIRQEMKTRSRLFPAWTMGADADMIAAQKRYLARYATESETHGYVLFNFSLGTDVRYAHGSLMHLHFQINNLFDTSWQSNLSRLKYFEYYKSAPGNRFGMFGMGRNFCLKLIVPF